MFLTYKYTQHIPSTVMQKMPGIPMSLLGIPGASYTVTANRTYQADTGSLTVVSPLAHQEKTTKILIPNGSCRLPGVRLLRSFP